MKYYVVRCGCGCLCGVGALMTISRYLSIPLWNISRSKNVAIKTVYVSKRKSRKFFPKANSTFSLIVHIFRRQNTVVNIILETARGFRDITASRLYRILKSPKILNLIINTERMQKCTQYDLVLLFSPSCFFVCFGLRRRGRRLTRKFNQLNQSLYLDGSNFISINALLFLGPIPLPLELME